MSMPWKPVCIVLAAIVCGTARGGEPGKVWQGMLGSNEIVVEINTPEKGSVDLEGRYFYRRHRLDIALQGTASADGRVTLKEGLRDDDPHPGWSMQAPANGSWNGEWTGPKNKRLPIHLREVTLQSLQGAREPGLQALRGGIDSYQWLRLSGLALQKKKLQQINGYTLQWLHQPESGIDLFEVTAGYPQPQLQRINAVLRNRLWNWVGNYYDCVSGARDGQGEYQTTTTLRLISPKVLSASLFSSFYCGGAHPDFDDAPINLDPRDARELDLDDVLWLGPGKALHAAKDNGWNQAWADYRSKRFAPWAVAQLEAAYPSQFASDGKDDDACAYGDPSLWEFPAWYATPKGIHIAAYFARYARACDNPDWAILPWKAVDAHPGVVRIH